MVALLPLPITGRAATAATSLTVMVAPSRPTDMAPGTVITAGSFSGTSAGAKVAAAPSAATEALTARPDAWVLTPVPPGPPVQSAPDRSPAFTVDQDPLV